MCAYGARTLASLGAPANQTNTEQWCLRLTHCSLQSLENNEQDDVEGDIGTRLSRFNSVVLSTFTALLSGMEVGGCPCAERRVLGKESVYKIRFTASQASLYLDARRDRGADFNQVQALA
jgi:hypothetical protein